MATVRVFLQENGRERHALDDLRRTQRVVVCHVTGLTPGNDNWEDAVTESRTAVNALATTADRHPLDDDLPLRESEATLHGAGVALVQLVYGYGRSDAPISDAFNFAKEQTYGELEVREWFYIDPDSTPKEQAAPFETKFTFFEDTFDDPTGVTQVNGIGLRSRKRPSPKHRIIVPTALATNAVSSTVALFGRVNSDDVVINGDTREAGSLVYRGLQVTPTEREAGPWWVTGYVFDWNPDKWTTQRLLKFPSSFLNAGVLLGTGVVFYVYDTKIRGFNPPSAAFANQFPTHDGTGPAAA